MRAVEGGCTGDPRFEGAMWNIEIEVAERSLQGA
jgi:hypothetical protein